MEMESFSGVPVNGVKRKYLIEREEGASAKKARHTDVDIGSMFFPVQLRA
jgi:hypothetical protein